MTITRVGLIDNNGNPLAIWLVSERKGEQIFTHPDEVPRSLNFPNVIKLNIKNGNSKFFMVMTPSEGPRK